MSRLAIQLYTLRRRPEPLPGLIREAAHAGFEGVEFAQRFQRSDPEQVGAALRGVQMEAVAAHVDLEILRANREALLDRCDIVDCHRLVIPHIPIERFRSRPHLDGLANELDEIGKELGEQGFDLLVHTTRELLLPFLDRAPIRPVMGRDGLPRGVYNHLAWAASRYIDRRSAVLHTETPLGALAANTEYVSFEIDAKSVATADFRFDQVLSAFEPRVDLVHLSDVRTSRRFPPAYRPVLPGDGIVDVESVLSDAMRHDIEWIVAEHDDPSNDDDILLQLAERAKVQHGVAEVPLETVV